MEIIKVQKKPCSFQQIIEYYQTKYKYGVKSYDYGLNTNKPVLYNHAISNYTPRSLTKPNKKSNHTFRYKPFRNDLDDSSDKDPSNINNFFITKSYDQKSIHEQQNSILSDPKLKKQEREYPQIIPKLTHSQYFLEKAHSSLNTKKIQVQGTQITNKTPPNCLQNNKVSLPALFNSKRRLKRFERKALLNKFENEEQNNTDLQPLTGWH